MSLRNLEKPLTRFLFALVALGLMAGCDSDRKNKRSAPTPAACGEGLDHGQSQDLTLYRSEFAAFGQKCEELAFQGSVACDEGAKTYLFNGSPSCEETGLKSLSIKGNSQSIEIGQTLGLSLQAVDQREGTFEMDPRKAEWHSAHASVSVSDSGLVTGTEVVADVAIWATVGEIKSTEFIVTILGKSCEGTPHGIKKSFNRFKAAKVAFNQTCEAIEAQATCVNGSFTFDEGVNETCEVAKLKELVADPSSLFLSKGETAFVNLLLVDEIGTRIPADLSKVSWTLPADLLSQSNGQITALAELSQEVKVTASFQDFTATITVASLASRPDTIKFEQNQFLLKVGDEQVLKVLTAGRGETLNIEPQRITWESSQPTQVSVSEGKIKALVPGVQVIITAKLDQASITATVDVEANLSLEVQRIEGRILTSEKRKLLPAATALISGPMQNQQPELLAATAACQFSIHKNRKVWELDVQLDVTSSEIPGSCDVEIAIASAAGQTVKQTVSIPVDFRFFKFTELRTADSQGTFEVAQLNYQLSKNLKVKSFNLRSFSNAEVSPADCKLSLIEKDGGFTVMADREATQVGVCSGYVHLQLTKEGSDEDINFYELATLSKRKTFLEYCQSPDNAAIEATVKAIRKEVSPSAPCEKVAELLRSKNLYAAANKNDTFALALANKGLTALEPVARFVGLKELDLANNKNLSNLEVLAETKLLRLLNLKATAVTDLKPLYQHKQMNDLRLPAGLKPGCSELIINPEIKKVCE